MDSIESSKVQQFEFVTSETRINDYSSCKRKIEVIVMSGNDSDFFLCHKLRSLFKVDENLGNIDKCVNTNIDVYKKFCIVHQI